MKNLALVLVLALSSAVFAQPNNMQEKKKKMEAMRVAHITEDLDLSVEEAQVFWPVFNEREKKIDALRMEFMGVMQKLKNDGKTIDDLSDSELEKMMQTKLNNEIKIAEIRKDYHKKFVDAVGVKKTAKLYQSEMHFMRMLLEKTRGPKNGKGNNQGGPGNGQGKGKGNGPNANGYGLGYGYGNGGNFGNNPNCPNK